MLHKDPKLKEISPINEIVRIEKQLKSLKMILTKTKLLFLITDANVKNVRSTKLHNIPQLLEGSGFLFKEKQKFKIKSDFICD